MNILILGSGGREHALAWKIAQSPKLSNLFIAPGNAGTAQVGINLDFSVIDFQSIKLAVLKYQIELVVVGPEVPLVKGIHDFFLDDNEIQHVNIIGPKKEGAQLEGSKKFAKEFMIRHKIPTAKYQSFTKKNLKEAFQFLNELTPPYVLKADGLAAGKGVLIIHDIEKAKEEITEMLTNDKFGKAGSTLVIEEFLDGIEMSCFVLTNGNEYIILPNAKDYKRIGEGDTGLNTGGMGAVSPVPYADEILLNEIEGTIIRPSILGLKKDNIRFTGFLFIGLMIINHKPFVIEYNVRLGDPETEVIIPRIESDLVGLFKATISNNLFKYKLKINSKTAVTVMAVSNGYPEAYEKENIIDGLETNTESLIFHSGTKEKRNTILTNGGRVLAVTSLDTSLKDALEKSYQALKNIYFKGITFRNDIGFDL
jgi:phosphoribosylamine--glycine ligase